MKQRLIDETKKKGRWETARGLIVTARRTLALVWSVHRGLLVALQDWALSHRS